MTTLQEPGTLAAERDLVLTRIIHAPRDRVFDAFTKADQLMHWWGPKGFTMLVSQLDLRLGGLFHYCLQSPDGLTMWGKFVYREINAPEGFVFVSSFSDEQGNLTRHPFSTMWPLEVLNTITLTEEDCQTMLTLRGRPINASDDEQQLFDESHRLVKAGFSGTFDQLDAYLSM
jgi:uncharacterized protein YndB with AHSA1/START domain